MRFFINDYCVKIIYILPLLPSTLLAPLLLLPNSWLLILLLKVVIYKNNINYYCYYYTHSLPSWFCLLMIICRFVWGLAYPNRLISEKKADSIFLYSNWLSIALPVEVRPCEMTFPMLACWMVLSFCRYCLGYCMVEILWVPLPC